MDPGLHQISQLLEASLDPRTNKSAEQQLGAEEKKPSFAVSLLRIVADENAKNTTRLAGALCFKNFLKREWIVRFITAFGTVLTLVQDAEGNHMLPQNEVTAIKQEIVGLMISVPPNIQAQLGDAVGIIADSDFWRGWDTLIDVCGSSLWTRGRERCTHAMQDLVSRLSPDDFAVNNGVLQVAHSIFKRWRPLFRSDELFTEINHVLSGFGSPFLNLIARTDSLLDESIGDKSKTSQLLTTINLIMKLIYDLCCQDLPPIFEENISQVAFLLQKYLTLDQPSLHTDTDEESGPLEYLKASVFEVLTLYVQKYEDAIQNHIGEFIQRSWELLTTIGLEAKYDFLVSKALHFLTSATRIREHANIFKETSHLSQVIEKVILPNLTLRETDVELFEDEPIEFIRRSLEGSDSDTRRNAATDFLQGLLSQHEENVTNTANNYVTHFLSEYTAMPAQNWKSKDTAIHLFCSIAAKGSVTSREGVKSVSARLNVVEFFQNNVANDLVSDEGLHPILQVDAIKYLYVFRSQFDQSQWASVFPLLVRRLASMNYVVYTYTAIAVERALALTNDSQQPVIDRGFVNSYAKDLLGQLFKLINKDIGADGTANPNKIQENEFLMRCVMRILMVIREGVATLANILFKHLIEITKIVSANPSNPRFCYYLFEALGAVIKFSGQTKVMEAEPVLWPPFFAILEADIQDFIPYVLQLFAALLEAYPPTLMPANYEKLVPLSLKVDMWQVKGNVPALVRLLSAMISKAPSSFIQNHEIEPVLGIFERLLVVRSHEIQACELLECILLHFPPSAMANYYVPLMNLVLSKLDRSGESFRARYIKLYHFISAHVSEGLGADFFIQIIDKLGDEKSTKNLYVTLYLKVILPGTPKLARPVDRKTAIISLTRTLTSSSAFAEKYEKGWGFTCNTLLELLINPPVVARTDDVVVENDVDDSAFGVGFTQLVTVRKQGIDQWPEIQDVKEFVSDELTTADAQKNGQIGKYVQERLSPESRQALLAYMQAKGTS